jgi:hypothetical protein
MADDFDWGELGSDWWVRTAAQIGASEKHAKFAARKHAGATNTDAARSAGFGGGSDGSTRSEGYRLFRSNKINQLLAMATAESGTGYDGTVTKQESKSILSHLARGSDPQVRIKSIELLNKLEREEAAANNARAEETLEENFGKIITLVPEGGIGAFMALSVYIHSGAFIGNFPFLAEVAPILSRNFPDVWQEWRAKQSAHWFDFLDKMAAGPFLGDDELIAAVKAKDKAKPVIVKVKPIEAPEEQAMASIPNDQTANIVERLARVDRQIEQQQKFDAAVAAALDRIQKTKQLQKRIRRAVRA